MYRVREQIACPDEAEIQGEPTVIAFLDTGVSGHPDFQNRIIGFKDFVGGKEGFYDDSGHGTHVCGIAAGNGELSDGKYRGVAPKSRIVAVKVLDKNGDGTIDHMIEGLSWIISNRESLKIRVVNISIGAGILRNEEKKQELLEIVEKAWSEGLVVVCAAGNLGPERGTISPLGVSSRVITVGCHDGEYFKDKSNRCETYSGRGPTKYAIKKPDLVAPGTEIVSCNGEFRSDSLLKLHAYSKKSGTSMATPMVSGAAALLLQKNPRLNNEMVKKKLLYAATDLKEPWTKQGWGMLNIRRALSL